MTITIETITPEIAKEYLATSVGNRPLRERDVAKYVRDLKAGEFVLTHQGIAFDEGGHLSDGHHRLTAIALSGVSAQMIVARQVNNQSLQVIDTGLKRNLSDSMFFDNRYSSEDKVYFRHKGIAAAVRQLVKYGYNSSLILSNSEMYKLMDTFSSQLEIIYHASVTKSSEPAAVRAAALSALLCGESEADIRLFFDVFSLGKPQGSEEKNISAAFNWKKQILDANVKKASFSSEKLYSGTQNAIWNYIHQRDTTFIRPTKNARYPVSVLIKAVLERK